MKTNEKSNCIAENIIIIIKVSYELGRRENQEGEKERYKYNLKCQDNYCLQM